MAIKFTLQDPSVTKARRKEFDRRNMNQKFVKWLYRKGFLEPYADKINLERSKRGKIPRGFDVHHIIPLSGGGTNHVSNFCLIERSLHKFINKKCFEPAVRHLKIGETVDIEIPDFPKVALRRDFNGFIDKKLQHDRDRHKFYQYLRRWER
ncbi:MAG: HNH endonuclease [Alphaproteobacteria bacterium]|nr:HNH endonuclease [Alphaproteobacteria bacterium]MBQ8557328.1 HNH endonuclease [Alphaproteobacteria bacterium]MBR3913086.1 HNH endonuclease [Alphaproteobacteria bacterium]